MNIISRLQDILDKAQWTATSVEEGKIYKEEIEKLIEDLKKLD